MNCKYCSSQLRQITYNIFRCNNHINCSLDFYTDDKQNIKYINYFFNLLYNDQIVVHYDLHITDIRFINNNNIQLKQVVDCPPEKILDKVKLLLAFQ